MHARPLRPLSSWRTLAGALLLAAAAPAQAGYTHFESPATHALAVSTDGSRLVVTNTPDHRLLVYSLANPRSPLLLAQIQVGLEPVSVALRGADEAWVVCSAADAVFVVDLRDRRVVDVVPTDDEPADVVLAKGKAFVSCTTDRRVLVFDAATRRRLKAVDVFADEPRALAAASDGGTVWVAAHRSGNRTTVVPHDKAPAQPPPTNPALPPPPPVGLIVDSENPRWKQAHGVTLPDLDVFEIDAGSLAVRRTYRGVGTTLFGMAARPRSNELWVANTQARNLVRYEPAVRGHVVDNRVTRIFTGASPRVVPVDLNPTIDYKILPNPAALRIALAQPTDVAFERSGAVAWIAAFGTDRVAALDAASGKVLARIEVGPAKGTAADPRRKRGPRALAMHPSAPLLYVKNQIANTVAVLDTARRVLVGEVRAPWDPTPREIREGRGYLYDAKLSGNGTMACAACHVDGREDGLAWDLGDPGGRMVVARGRGGAGAFVMHPMKGPMVTQTLQGLAGLEPYHWRGDRPDLASFNPAFASLMGGTPLAPADLKVFTKFLVSIAYPPNPNQNLDRSYPAKPPGESALDGLNFFNSGFFGSSLKCVDCHPINGGGTTGQIVPAFFLRDPQDLKVSQLRNVYKRTGRKPRPQGRTAGFGLEHDGTADSVFARLSEPLFGPLARNPKTKRMLERFVEAFDTGTAPTVGHGVALRAATASDPAVIARLDTLLSRAARYDCEVVAKGTLGGRRAGLFYDLAKGRFLADRTGAASFSRADLLAAARGGRADLVVMGVPVGAGKRLGIDHDGDNTPDGDESARPYGAASGGCAPAPALETNGEARLGRVDFALVARAAPPGARGVLVLGLARASVSILGITLLVDPASGVAADLAADARGVAALALPLPVDPKLAGATVHAQAVFVAPCGGQGLAASQGLTFDLRRR